MGIPNYGKEVYEELSKLVGIKFKAQIKDSGIELKKLLSIKDLITKENYYYLILDETSIKFKSCEDFIETFISYLDRNLKSLELRFNNLQGESKGRFVNKNTVFYENEYLGKFSYKQGILLKRMLTEKERTKVQ